MESNQVSYSMSNVPEYLVPYVELEDVVFDDTTVSTDKIKEILGKYSCFSDKFVKMLILAAQKVRPFAHRKYQEIADDFKVDFNYNRELTELQRFEVNRMLFGFEEKVQRDPVFPVDSIFYAATQDDLDKVVFMSSSIDITTVTEEFDGKPISLLDAAALAGALNVFKYLSINGCSIVPSTAENAIKGGNEEIIAMIVQAGVSFAFMQETSIQYHRQDITKWIIGNYETGSYSLDKIVAYYNTMALCYYIAKGDKPDRSLHRAVKSHSLGYTRILLANGADLEFQNRNQLITTVLCVAASHDDSDIVKFLIENNASMEERTERNETILMQAVVNKNLDLLQYLVEHGAKLDDTVPYNGLTALMYAAKVNFPEAITYLVSKGANINMQSKDGETALLIASSKRNFEAMKALLDCGADIEIQDKFGFTPLSIACYNNYLDAAQVLIDHGANINARTEDGRTILMVSASNLRPESVKFLVDKGADKTVTDKDGKTVYDYATERIKKYLD